MTPVSAPRPRRSGPTWKQFLAAQARGIIAADFVHVDTVLLRRIYALIVIEHGTRRAHLAGITANPDGSWTTQAARNLLMDLGQRATSVKFLIRDRAGQFTSSFDAVFTAEGIRILAGPPQAPRANAICERIIGTLRRELLDRLLIVNEHHLRQVLTEHLLHYNTARPHRSLGQLTPAQTDSHPPDPVNLAEHRIRRKQILSGLTCEYYIAALPPSVATGNAGHGPNRISEPHRELRHSFVSLMSISGVPVEEIARLAGHSNTRTTEVVYRRELRPVLTTGAEAMDRLFQSSSIPANSVRRAHRSPGRQPSSAA